MLGRLGTDHGGCNLDHTEQHVRRRVVGDYNARMMVLVLDSRRE